MPFVWQYPGKVDRVIDGDTLVALVKFAVDDARSDVNVRLEGINALELKERFGSEARDYLANLAPAGIPITLVHHKREKYGRFLARVLLSDGTDLSQVMVTAKASDGETPLAVPYMT